MRCSTGDSLQQETPQKERKDHSIRPTIAVNCTPALSLPSMLDALSSSPTVTSPGEFLTACSSNICLIYCMNILRCVHAKLVYIGYLGDVDMTQKLLLIAGSSAAASDPTLSHEEPLEHAESAAAGEELHLAPMLSIDISAAASSHASSCEPGEEHASETAEEATAASSAVPVSMVDESEGVEQDAAQEVSSKPEEVHLTPTHSMKVSAAASGYASPATETAEDSSATPALRSAVPVSSAVDESMGMEVDAAQEMSSEPAPDMHSVASTADEHSSSALASPGKLVQCLSPALACRLRV